MCGIIGLLIKKPALRSELGRWMTPMLIGMTERGPDSAGLAVFSDPLSDENARKISVYAGLTALGAGFDWHALVAALEKQQGSAVTLQTKDNHAIITVTGDPVQAQQFIKAYDPLLHLLSLGRSIDLYKDIGMPAAVAQRYDFAHMSGSHVVGHTRMATESAVTPDRAHPFTAGQDFCMVHNGSLSNPYQIRRMLEPRGIKFDTDNDTESACRFIEWRMREGDDLKTALETGFD